MVRMTQPRCRSRLRALAAIGLAACCLPAAKGEITFITTWGSYGATNGRFNAPHGVAVSATGQVYVADAGNRRVQRFDSTGVFETAWGSYGIGHGQFYFPCGVAVAPSGDVYVSDRDSGRIQRFDANGVYETEWGTYGSGNEQFIDPHGVAVAPSGRVYVADTGNARIQRFDADGGFELAWGVWGTGERQFMMPRGVAVSATGQVYVADTDNDRIQRFDAGGLFETQWGGYGTSDGRFRSPYGVTVSAAGKAYVADLGNWRIQRFDADGAFETKWGTFGSGNGQFRAAFSVAVADTGLVYVSDPDSDRIQRFFDSEAWVSGTNVFTDPARGPVDVGVGAGQLLGESVTLDASKGLVVGNWTVIEADGTLHLAGGALTTAVLRNVLGGTFLWTAGTLTITGMGGVTVGDNLGLIPSTTIDSVKALHVTGPTTVLTGGSLSLAGGTWTTGSAENAGRLTVLNPAVDFGTGLLNTNELVLVDTTVTGPVTSPAGSAINVIGVVTFEDGLSGAGGIYGSGTAVFNGGHDPGDSAAVVTVEGSVVYGPTCTLRIQLVGEGNDKAGDPVSDAVAVGGDLHLGGTLSLEWLPVGGDPGSKFGGVYRILSSEGTLTGTFDRVDGQMAAYLDTSVFPEGICYDEAGGEVKVHLHGLLDADADLGGEVGWEDLLALQSGSAMPDPSWFDGDFNFDGQADFRDYLLWKANVGRTVPGGAIPEPAVLVLLVAAGPVLLRRRRS